MIPDLSDPKCDINELFEDFYAHYERTNLALRIFHLLWFGSMDILYWLEIKNNGGTTEHLRQIGFLAQTLEMIWLECGFIERVNNKRGLYQRKKGENHGI